MERLPDSLIEAGTIDLSQCYCGRTVLSTERKCAVCLQHQQRGASPIGSSSSTQTRSGRSRPHAASVGEALATVFKSEADQPNLFPSSFYRTPSRSRSRSGDDHLPGVGSSPLTSRSAMKSPIIDSNRLAQCHQSLRERSYSPMAAGFARLSQKNVSHRESPESSARGRSGGGRSSLELEAKLFSGPA